MTVTVTTDAPDGWDHWVAAQGDEGGFCQSSVWADVARRANGDRAWFVSVEGRARALVTQARPRRPLPRTAWPVRCIDGPLLASDATGADLGALLAALRRLGGGRGGAGVWLAPAPRARRLAPHDDELASLGYEHRPQLTALVPLTDLDAHWTALPRPVRKNIDRCRREGVEVLECEGVEGYRSHFAPAYAGTRPGDDQMADAGADHYRFFVAQRHGEALATLGTYRWRDLVTEIASGRTGASPLPAQDLLHWHVFERARAEGAAWFDLASFEVDPVSEKEAGIRRFKEKWGGTTVSLDRWSSPPADPVARLLRGARSTLAGRGT